MPRRLLSLLLALLCLVGSGSVALQQHHCMGTQAGVSLASLTPEEHHRCDRCGMDRKASKGCCEDVVKVLKADEGQRFFPAPYAVPVLEWVILPQPVWGPQRPVLPPRLATTGTAHESRPPPAGLPRFLRLRVLRL